MRIEETRWERGLGWKRQTGVYNSTAQLVLYFGNRSVLRDAERYNEMRAAYPQARIIGCSATRTIVGDALDEDCIVAAAVSFEQTPIRMARRSLGDISESREAGEALGKELAADDLAGVIVLADGLLVDGSALVSGICDIIGNGPLLVGGMASDSSEYTETLVGADDPPDGGMAAAIGFYGDAIRFANGCASGWDPFGPRRQITRSTGNVLHELDGRPAFELYERYMGEEIADGVRAGVILPLEISQPEHPERATVRSLLSVDYESGSMTFGGHTPEGWIARLMRGNLDRLIMGAADAAKMARVDDSSKVAGDSLALMVSCAGRLLSMGQRTEEELEVAGAELGPETRRIGFYSNGEIAPMRHSGISEIHNQTMTITTLFEACNSTS
jgi:hypothetical protein